MGVVLAIDPGRRHGKVLDRLTSELRGHEIVIATSGDEALAVFESRIPELVIFPLVLAPADEARIQSRLRGLPDTTDLQALTIPFRAFFDGERHAARPAAIPPRWYYWFRPRNGTDAVLSSPSAFSEAVRAGVDRPRTEAPATFATPAAPPLQVSPPPPPPPPVELVLPHAIEPEREPAPEPWRQIFEIGPIGEPDPREDRDDTPTFPTPEEEEPGPGRMAGLWAALSTATAAVSGLGRGLRYQAERVPRVAWGIAGAVVVVGTLGVNGYVSRWAMAPVHWAKSLQSNWFPEQPKTGTAEIFSDPDGSQVWLNGRQIGLTPLKAEFAVGTHEIELRYRGSTRTVTLDVTPGGAVVERIEWAAPAPRPVGKLRIESEPSGATVAIDGRAVGVTPLTTEDLPIGKHTVDLTAGGNTAQETVEVRAGRTTTVSTSVFQGWLALFSPIELRASIGGRAVRLDDQNRALVPAGTHVLTIQNRPLGYLDTRTISITAGQTTAVSVEMPRTHLTVTASGPAEVWVDGVRIGFAPVLDLPVDIGTREVLVRSAEHGDRRVTVTATMAPTRVAVDLTAPIP